MLNYNSEYIPRGPNTWSDADQMRQQVESDGRNYQQSRNSRNQRRATDWKKKNQKKEEPAGPKIDPRAKVETPGVTGTMYNTGPIRSLNSVSQEYGQNFDFSSFRLIVERTYRDMTTQNALLPRHLPYCAYLHHCTTALTATIIDVAQNVNKIGAVRDEGQVKPYLEDMVLPATEIKYILSTADTTTLTKHYEDLNLKFTSTTIHRHALAASARNCAEEL